MAPSLNFFMLLLLSAFMGIASRASPVLDQDSVPEIQGLTDLSKRSSDTCADPTLTSTMFQGFSGSLICHILNFHWAFVDNNSRGSSGTEFWSFHPAFKAWPTQQPFTVPLFRLTTPGNTDYIFMVGADANTPPIVGGFSEPTVIGWVYNTPVCDSVPLMSLVLSAKSDHYYTLDPAEHAVLLSGGWTDGGVVAYVLPLPTS